MAKEINVVKFNKSEFDLSSYSSNTFSGSKIQETSSLKLLSCLDTSENSDSFLNLENLFNSSNRIYAVGGRGNSWDSEYTVEEFD